MDHTWRFSLRLFRSQVLRSMRGSTPTNTNILHTLYFLNLRCEYATLSNSRLGPFRSIPAISLTYGLFLSFFLEEQLPRAGSFEEEDPLELPFEDDAPLWPFEDDPVGMSFDLPVGS